MFEQLTALRTLGHDHMVPIISWETEHFLCTHLDKVRPLHCLEIWSAIGYSTLVMGSLLSSRHGHITSFEISLPSYRVARAQLATSWLDNVLLYHGDITRFPQRQWQGVYDFVFVDGAKAQYASYIELLRPYLATWATLICDDVIVYAHKMHTLQSTLDHLHAGYESVSLADGDGVLVITKL